MAKDIYPDFHRLLHRKDKEKRLHQHAKVIWMTGLSGAGKTTLARKLEWELSRKGFLIRVLDGDNIRTGINKDLKFSPADRHENIRRVAEVSKLFLDCGIICINSFISPTKALREMAKTIVGSGDFIEIYVNAPLEVCEKRDVKGLYKKARAGLLRQFTGIDAPFEPPENPDMEVRTDRLTVETTVKKCLDFILPQITFSREEGQ